MKTKHKAIFFALVGASNIFNAIMQYKLNNMDATFAWLCASGGFFGMAGMYLEQMKEE